MPAGSIRITLRDSFEMESCREALISAGHGEDETIVQELEVFALRAKASRREVCYTVIPQEAGLVLEALTEQLRATPPERQALCGPKVILRHVEYVPAQAA